jgi:excisionase family DNA binding protein
MSTPLAYTLREACEAIRVGRTKFYELLAAGDIKAVALGGKTLIPRASLEAYLAQLPPIPLQKGPSRPVRTPGRPL